ncbi:MAG: hypothetical protein Q4C45_00625 [Oscillospiraceae bacterium]|nr:hypothetical protein [Oscillospiraceae bacterium]
MKQTENYQLNQWDPTDRIMMEDFNADNARLDAALTGQGGQLAALAAALAAKGNCSIAVTSYTGAGGSRSDVPSKPTTVQFQKKPVFFIIKGDTALLFATGASAMAACISPTVNWDMAILGATLTWNGSLVSISSSYVNYQMDETGKLYEVIAFYAEDAK